MKDTQTAADDLMSSLLVKSTRRAPGQAEIDLVLASGEWRKG